MLCATSEKLRNIAHEDNNHLGNVLTVLSDRKIPRDDNSNGVIDYFVADVLSTTDYYIREPKENNLKQALATTIDKSGIKEFNNIQIQYLPTSVYAYNVGKNTLESQK